MGCGGLQLLAFRVCVGLYRFAWSGMSSGLLAVWVVTYVVWFGLVVCVFVVGCICGVGLR